MVGFDKGFYLGFVFVFVVYSDDVYVRIFGVFVGDGIFYWVEVVGGCVVGVDDCGVYVGEYVWVLGCFDFDEFDFFWIVGYVEGCWFVICVFF